MKMNTLLHRLVLVSAISVTALAALYAIPASAYGRGGYYHGGGHTHVGIGIGLNFFPGYYRPYYYSPIYYDYPYYPNEVIVRTVPAPTTVYVEESPSSPSPIYRSNDVPNAAPTAGGNVWYYCHNPDGFYPSIKSCPGGWQKVPASPPPSEK